MSIVSGEEDLNVAAWSLVSWLLAILEDLAD